MNIYEILNIPFNANLLEICTSYEKACFTKPLETFIYTKALHILINKNKRLIYDAALTKKDIRALYNSPYYDNLYDIDEYDLLPFIIWLNDFKNYFYDLKYFIQNKTFLENIEKWYDTIETISETLKDMIKSFYLT